MTPFKICPSCHHEWETREQFLEDSSLQIVGYQVNFSKLEQGFFLFNHRCGTSLAIMANGFKDLYGGPIFSERQTGGKDCPKFCLIKEEIRPCPAKCECAYVREIIQIIRNRPPNAIQ